MKSGTKKIKPTRILGTFVCVCDSVTFIFQIGLLWAIRQPLICEKWPNVCGPSLEINQSNAPYHAPPMHQPMHSPACPSPNSKPNPHPTYMERHYMILLLLANFQLFSPSLYRWPNWPLKTSPNSHHLQGGLKICHTNLTST